jgi:hypothetical protein
MTCDWRGIKTGSRIRHRKPLPPPTIRYWLPANYGLCVRAVTYVRHAVVLDMPRTFERSRDRRLRAYQDMKDGCTAASAPSVRVVLPSAWEEATTEHSESVRWLNANVWSWPSPGLRHQEVHGLAETRQKWNGSSPGYCLMLTLTITEMAGEQVVLFILRSPDVADRRR